MRGAPRIPGMTLVVPGPVWHPRILLLTGGTGSLGRALTRFLLAQENGPALIRIYSRSEHAQAEMAREFNDPRLRFLIGDVRDELRLARAMDGVDSVVHAAALKIVPLAEYNPVEAVRTNVLGTMNVVEAALDRHVERVLFISSDKAAGPLNLYGATKLVAEKVIVDGNEYGGDRTLFGAVRYGNVVGSRGSLLEVIRRTDPVPLTDPTMTRWWITLEDACRFIWARLLDLRPAVAVPILPAYRVPDFIAAANPGSRTVIVGVRPGEKIAESLITEDEAPFTTAEDGFFLIWRDPRGAPNEALRSDRPKKWLTVDEMRAMLA